MSKPAEVDPSADPADLARYGRSRPHARAGGTGRPRGAPPPGRWDAFCWPRLRSICGLGAAEIIFTLTVTNGTPQTIEHLWPHTPSLFAYLGPLPPGKTVGRLSGRGTRRGPSGGAVAGAVTRDIAPQRIRVEPTTSGTPGSPRGAATKRVPATGPWMTAFSWVCRQTSAELGSAGAARATHVLFIYRPCRQRIVGGKAIKTLIEVFMHDFRAFCVGTP